MIDTEFKAKWLKGFFANEIKDFKVGGPKDFWQLLFFYPRDFTFVCPTELLELNRYEKAFRELETEVFAISSDSEYCHQGWCKSRKDLNFLTFPLIADPDFKLVYPYPIKDFTPSHTYLRATIILNPEGRVKFFSLNDDKVGRSIVEIIRVLEALQTDKLTPCDWKPGGKTLD